MEEEKRLGRQTPTRCHSLPYTSTYGADAVDLYNKSGKTAQQWQELLLYDILAYNEDGLWTHTKYGYSVPRRNGKSEILFMREIYGITHGEKILHTAHRTTTAHSAWERICDLLNRAGYVEGETFKTSKQFGLETVTMLDGSDGKLCFRTRSSKGGLGEGYDLLIIDEAQEYQDDQESALKYVVTDSGNPQTIMCGTPPTPTSSGTVFTKFRQNTLQGLVENSGWAEWSVDCEHDPRDKEAWYEANPSLGTVFTERSVTDEVGNDRIDFNIQRLGLWIAYSQKSEISKPEWDELQVTALPKLTGKMFIGIAYGHSGESVSMSIAIKSKGGKVFVEAIDCRPIKATNAWIIDFLQKTKKSTAKVVVDGASGQNILAAEMKDFRLKPPELPTVKQVIDSNSGFVTAVANGVIQHTGQPSLMMSVTNCERRAIGSGGGFGFRSIKDGVDVTLIESTALAFWAAYTDKPKAKQQISY